MPPGEDALASALADLERSLAGAVKLLSSVRRVVKKAQAGSLAAPDLTRLEAALRTLEGPPPGLARDFQRAVEALRALKARASRKRELGFAKELMAAARRLRLPARLVRTHPEEWRLGRLHAHMDPQQGTVVLRYARVPVMTGLPCDPDALLKACQEATLALARGSLAPDRFLELLDRAYETVLAARDQPLGERVHLAELARELIKQIASSRKSGPRYTRAQFAHDLARCRRERRLSYRGRRIDLGIATSGAARDPERVVFVEDDSGAGQYYLYFRMVPQRTARTQVATQREAGE